MTMRSKKWERRRPVTIILRSENGWHKHVKIRREDWNNILAACEITGETTEEFILRAILEATKTLREVA